MKNTFSASQKLNGSFNNNYIKDNLDIVDFNNSKLTCFSKIENDQLNKIKKLIGNKSDLDSEFLFDNRGQSFTKDNKNLNWNNKVFKKELLPAPNQYNPNNSLKYLEETKGSVKFGKKNKEFWLDEQPKSYAPGPIYNPKKIMISN